MKIQTPNFLKTGLQEFFKSPFFWVAGAGISILLLLRVCLNTSSEEGEWNLYFLFPLALVAVLLILNKFQYAFFLYIKSLLILLFLSLEFSLYFNLNVVLLAIVSFVILYYIKRKSMGSDLNVFSWDRKALPIFFVYLISWQVCVKVGYWQNFNAFISNGYSVFILCASFLYIIFSGYEFEPKNLKFSGKSLSLLKWLIPVFIFGWAALRVNESDYGQLHHWGCFVGPAELVRQGGYLLWNVPSQYGFLSILSIVVLPFDSCWESFYFLQVIFLIFSSLILFSILYSSNKSPLNYFFSIGIVFLAVFLIPGGISSLRGVSSYPSVGPYRFIWVQVILFFIVFQYRKKYFNEKTEHIAGSIIWLLSTLWAFEVAFYVGFTWFGYLIIKSIHVDDHQGLDYKKSMANIIRKISLPVVLFLISLVLICLYYLIRLNHLPDFLSYYEHVLSFKEGFKSILINPSGAVGVFLFILFFAVCFILQGLTDFKKYQDYIAVLVACILSLYACLSYFISRSHENNILNLTPVMVLVVAIITFINKSAGFSSSNDLFRSFTIPFYTVMVLITVGNKFVFIEYLASLKRGYSDVRMMNPPLDPSLKKLMISARISEKDSIAYMDDVMLINPMENKDPFVRSNHWLPMNPMTILNPITKDRIEVYMDRFGDQFQTGGFFIQNKSYGFDIEKFISHDYDSIGPVFENREWKIRRFVRKNIANPKQ